MKNFKHPLMENNFTKSDINSVIKLLKKKNVILTQSLNVLKFEKAWSKWLGVKYSVFVNSGSSANLLSISILKILEKKKKENVILPALTWSSDVASVIQNNLKPVFVDINLNNLSMNLEEAKKKINKKTLAVFITHAQGFNGLTKNFITFLKKKKIPLIEDVCESHGAKLGKKKLGTFGLISNFSFYYAHHMSTIEGGMICTNDKKIYELARLLRSHGMARELSDKKNERRIVEKNSKLSPKFIFMYPSYNMRNNEIGAVLGLNQLKRLDKNNVARNRNLKLFLSSIDSLKYYTDFNLTGSSNYAFPIILKTTSIKDRDFFEKTLNNYNIEFRRGNAGGGNQLRQPYVKNYIRNINLKKFNNVEKVHFFGYYIGNYPSLKKSKIIKICGILNSINI